MADEDKKDELESIKDELSKKEKPKPGAPHIALRIVLGVAGLLLLVGFFLPWLMLEGEMIRSISGLNIVLPDDEVVRALAGEGSQRYVLLLIPFFGIALTGIGFMGVRYSGRISAILGILIVGYGMVTVVIFFFQRTGIGLWLILLGAFIAVAAGTVTFIRSRGGAEPEPEPEPSD